MKTQKTSIRKEKGSERPLKDETEAIKDYEKARQNGTLELQRLENTGNESP
jgi:hypothetical protein